MIAPVIVNNQPWKKGYFETIGNIDVSASDKNINYAFGDVLKENYIDIKGDIVSRKYSTDNDVLKKVKYIFR